MSETSTAFFDLLLSEDSIAYEGDQSSASLEDDDNADIIDELKPVSLQDLLDSSEFIEEQRMILLEIETERLRIDDDKGRTPSRRSRRSSMGIKVSCPICLADLTSVGFNDVRMVTECGHVYCQACIENICETSKIVEGKTLCPVCREDVGELRKIYF